MEQQRHPARQPSLRAARRRARESPGYTRGEITEAAGLAAEGQARGAAGLDPKARAALRRLAARFIATRDQLDIIAEDRRAAILAARAAAKPLIAAQPGLIPLDAERFNPGRTVIDNILHARRRFDRRAAWKRLDDALDQVIEAEGLRPALIRLGLDRRLSEAGLSGSALRRVALIRAVLKRPAYVLLDGVAGGDGAEDAGLRARLRAELPDAALIYAASGDAAVEPGAQVIRIAPSGIVA